jgi:hypothetical protein
MKFKKLLDNEFLHVLQGTVILLFLNVPNSVTVFRHHGIPSMLDVESQLHLFDFTLELAHLLARLSTQGFELASL